MGPARSGAAGKDELCRDALSCVFPQKIGGKGSLILVTELPLLVSRCSLLAANLQHAGENQVLTGASESSLYLKLNYCYY